MPLGARDIMLVIRAKDQATRVIGGISAGFNHLEEQQRAAAHRSMVAGSALLCIGAGLSVIGGMSIQAFTQMKDDAVEYRQQVGLTVTQLDKVPATFDQIAQMGLKVARSIPVPLEQIQGGLYDIFSSMDVGLKDAGIILRSFSKGAVAGQVDLQVAGRSTIGILNAFDLEAKDVNRVMDLQFQLVRKGVGTYEQFATTIGRATGAAQSSGQTIETLSAMMAFLTRNGLSAAMASTSAARAMELIANPQVTKNLEAYGVQVRNADGSFRQMHDIVTQLAEHKGWAQMSDPARKKIFKDIFGTGSIQARRFFDMAIPNFRDLNKAQLEMLDSTGALGEAYKTMFDQPQSQSQLLANQWKALRIELGDALIPAFLAMTKALSRVVEWFNRLSPRTKRIIAFAGLAAAAFLTLVGVITALVGLFMLLSAAAAALSIGVGTLIAGILGAAGAILGLVGAGVALGLNWDSIKAAASEVWGYVDDVVQDTWEGMQAFADWISGGFMAAWEGLVGIGERLGEEFGDWWETTGEGAWERTRDSAQGFLDTLRDIPGAVADYAREVANTEAGQSVIQGAKDLWEDVKEAAGDAWGAIKDGSSEAWDALQDFWDWLSDTWIDVWHDIQDAIDDFETSISDAADSVEEFHGKLMETDAWKDWEAWTIENTRYMGLFVDEVEETIGAIDRWGGAFQGVLGGAGGATFSENIRNLPSNFMDMLDGLWMALGTFEPIWDGQWKLAAEQVARFQADVGRIWEDIQVVWEDWLTNMDAFTSEVWNALWTGMSGPVSLFYNSLLSILTGIRDLFVNLFLGTLDLVQGDWEEFHTKMVTAAEGLRNALGGILGLIAAVIWMPFALGFSIVIGLWNGFRAQTAQIANSLMNLIGSILGTAWDVITYPFRIAINAVVALWNWLYDVLVGNSIVPDLVNEIGRWFAMLPGKIASAIVSLPGMLINTFRNMFNSAYTTIASGIDSIVRFFSGLGDRILGAVGNLGSLLTGVGASIVGGLNQGIQSGIGTIQSTLGTITDNIPDWKGPPERDARLLLDNGKLIMQGFNEGLKSGIAPVEQTLRDVTDMMALYHDTTGAIASQITAQAHPVGNGLGTPNGQVTIGELTVNFEFPGVKDAEGIQEAVEQVLIALIRKLQAGAPLT
jgi:TP901 family phage tail tape measure protein